MKTYKHERDVIKDIRKIYSKVPDHYLVKLNCNTLNGFPDIVAAFKPNKIIFFEVKKEGGKFTEIQIATLKKMRKAGMLAFGLVADNSEWTRLVDFYASTYHTDTLYENCYGRFTR